MLIFHFIFFLGGGTKLRALCLLGKLTINLKQLLYLLLYIETAICLGEWYGVL